MTRQASPRSSKRKQQASIFETINNDKNKVFRGMCNTTALVPSDIQDKTDTTVSLACKRIARAANGGSDVLVRVRMGCQATGQVPLVYTTATDQSLWDLVARLRCVLQGGTGDGGDSAHPPTPHQPTVEFTRAYDLNELRSRMGGLSFNGTGKYTKFSTLVDAVASDTTEFDKVSGDWQLHGGWSSSHPFATGLPFTIDPPVPQINGKRDYDMSRIKKPRQMFYTMTELLKTFEYPLNNSIIGVVSTFTQKFIKQGEMEGYIRRDCKPHRFKDDVIPAAQCLYAFVNALYHASKGDDELKFAICRLHTCN